MATVLKWAGAADGLPVHALVEPATVRRRAANPLPPAVASALWRGADLGTQTSAVVASGFAALDRELPGGGWPCHALTEVLSAQPAVLEWRLVGPALRSVVAGGGAVVVVGPPQSPHLPGLHHAGIDAQHLVWVQADTLAERLWCIEQLIRANACGALLAWLPQARPEQMRRLQVGAQACTGPVFLFRPAPAQHESSAAPLRVRVGFGLDWELQVQVLKRRGPAHDGLVRLASVPGGLSSVLTPRLRQPSRLFSLSSREVPDALGRPVAPLRPRRHAAAG